jgi:hypothetical protein
MTYTRADQRRLDNTEPHGQWGDDQVKCEFAESCEECPYDGRCAVPVEMMTGCNVMGSTEDGGNADGS